MLPLSSTEIENGIEIVTQTSNSYKIKMDKERIVQYVDGIEAVKQAIYKVLMTERYQHTIYNWNYGIELSDLLGKSKSYVKAELPKRIEEALKPDDRIEEVYDFEFTDIDKTTLAVTFTAKTIFGNLEIEKEVTI